MKILLVAASEKKFTPWGSFGLRGSSARMVQGIGSQGSSIIKRYSFGRVKPARS